jgi:hypothetical protein
MNTIQLVFLSETYVFVSISRLFRKIGVSKMYPKFKMLIFRYKTRFFYEIFDIPRIFLGTEHEFAVIFCPRPRGYGQNGLQRTELSYPFLTITPEI